MPTTSTYVLIKSTVPITHSVYSGLIWDLTNPYIYISSSDNYQNIGNGLSYIYKYNRQTKTLDLTKQNFNPNAPFGSPGLDGGGRLYYSPPGGVTYSIQQHAAYETAGLTLIAKGENQTGPTTCVLTTGVAGDYFTDTYKQGQFWWHVSNSDLNPGFHTCFYQDRFCTADNALSKSPLMVYFTSPDKFNSLIGFETTGFRWLTAASDGSGTLWSFFAGTGTDGNSHWIMYRVPTSGTPVIDADLTPVFMALAPGDRYVSDAYMRYFKNDSSFILVVGRVWMKYSPGIGASLVRVRPGNASGLIQSRTHQGAFRHPDPRMTTIWVADTLADASHPVDPNALNIFPRFTEYRMSDLSVKNVLVSYEIGQEYPFNLGTTVDGSPNFFRFWSPTDVLHDPDEGTLWTTSIDRHWLAIFRFQEVDIIPPPTVTGNPGGVGRQPHCVPKNSNFNPFT